MLLDSGTLFLYDVSSQKEVSTFTKQPAGMTTSAFFIGKRSPGSFITCSDRNDVLKVWNVAQPNFLKTIRVGIASGLHTVRIQTGLDLEGHAMKDCKVICSFSNGAVALYSTATGKLNWHGASGHTESASFRIRCCRIMMHVCRKCFGEHRAMDSECAPMR